MESWHESLWETLRPWLEAAWVIAANTGLYGVALVAIGLGGLLWGRYGAMLPGVALSLGGFWLIWVLAGRYTRFMEQYRREKAQGGAAP